MDRNTSIIELARKVLGDHKLAESWVNTKLASFENKTPLEVFNSSLAGREKVATYLNNMRDVICASK
ncbi:MbcA/ParS/Xre antitoxin family protein [Neiella marina]|uniref:MbcA/ParS/Xre antitoxin family protein n=1 Tax=Neiella holothuriorum TaxID=2870530 RepID=A0ABS7ELL5_9GAMM|nr:MbcA/ParS/Xre antitoxin family protein [Neiella holothuriorum]